MKNLQIELMNKKPLKVFECFAGVGSQHMALRNIGANFEIVGISEIDKYAIDSYNAIHGHTKNYGDISKIDPKDLPNIDLLTYSFPCQDLSIAGLQKGINKNTRSGLLYECKKIIEEKKPKFLLLENVKNLVSKKFKGDFDLWLDYLTSLGYKNYWKVLNAKNYGVPQNRERVFVVSILDGQEFNFNNGYPTNKRIKNILESYVDEKFYINKPFKLSEKKDRGQNNILVVGNYHKSNHSASRILNINGIAPTVMENHGTVNAISNNYRVRKITPKECWRLMGFNDQDFEKARKVCSNSQLYKQAGNSIVVNVLESIFLEMLKQWD